jgi:hypothetical protein
MIKLAEWLTPYITSLFPPHATIVDDGGRRMRIDWRIPEEGRPNRRAQSIAIHVDRHIINAMEAADAAELSRIGSGFVRLIKQRLKEYDPKGPQGMAFLIVIDSCVLD